MLKASNPISPILIAFSIVFCSVGDFEPKGSVSMAIQMLQHLSGHKAQHEDGRLIRGMLVTQKVLA